ncbi:hypothetical protein [Rhizobium sp. PL01]|uniref:hypothetical protein n=1 Tax=Rhizobium sp. PL01 TaxID=3085631 RepID=UPI0029813BE9|nr:hypothetical protein [Rhizobium sp. PL01]MDW5314990.1 hypothetical protein [Rhizobium sp. PL01]
MPEIIKFPATFRVHFNDPAIEPFDIDACTATEVRDRMKALRPGQTINKIKIVREKI